MIKFDDVEELIGMNLTRYDDSQGQLGPADSLKEFNVDGRDIAVGLKFAGIPEAAVGYIMGGILLGLQIAVMDELTPDE